MFHASTIYPLFPAQSLRIRVAVHGDQADRRGSATHATEHADPAGDGGGTAGRHVRHRARPTRRVRRRTFAPDAVRMAPPVRHFPARRERGGGGPARRDVRPSPECLGGAIGADHVLRGSTVVRRRPELVSGCATFASAHHVALLRHRGAALGLDVRCVPGGPGGGAAGRLWTRRVVPPMRRSNDQLPDVSCRYRTAALPHLPFVNSSLSASQRAT